MSKIKEHISSLVTLHASRIGISAFERFVVEPVSCSQAKADALGIHDSGVRENWLVCESASVFSVF